MNGRAGAPPLSTYRLQLHRDFPFSAAAARADYLRRLGADAVYLSPILAATPGSTHGYDVCDPGRLNPELGGEEGFEALSDALRAAGLGCVVDFVPNHMGADPACNTWWRDVLEKGPSSPYAFFFDIDWNPPKARLRGKVLLPVLGEAYGRVLERGELRLALEHGRCVLRYSGRVFPVGLGSDPELEEAARLGGPEAERLLEAVNGVAGKAETFDRLHALLEHQFYRLANWKTSGDEINYRRFFDVNELLGLRMEAPEVFAAVHETVLRLVRRGRITGLRIDHVDGLRQPLDYLKTLRAATEAASPGAGPCYLVVEKILCGDEALRPEWPVQGTTGYEFMADLNGLFVDARGLARIRRFYHRLSQRSETIAQEERLCKRLILTTTLASELNALAVKLDRLSEGDRMARDFTLEALRAGLRETLAGLKVYRTYGDREGFSPEDREAGENALLEAMEANPAVEPTLFDFLRLVLLPSDGDDTALPKDERLRLALRFQQLSGPVQAKGVEDTVFYRQVALLSLNEVGNGPAAGGMPVAEFHRRIAWRAKHFPHGMLGTSTHDTKRGEDARARINVLTEIPDAWRRAVVQLSQLTRAFRHRRRGRGPEPSPNDEYLLYQSLIGCWPIDEQGEPLPADEPLEGRVRGFVGKVIREAKVHGSWLRPNTAYEEAFQEFVTELLRGRFAGRFREILFPLIRTCARASAAHSLNQVACKCAAPGVPDIYQGSESWNLSLVDPDNRRPVDYDRLAADLLAMEPYLAPGAAPRDRKEWAASLLKRWPTGEVKQYLTARCLRWRREHPRLFLEGSYEPLIPDAAEDEWVAFARRRGDEALVTVLRTRALGKDPESALSLPAEWRGRSLVHLFTGTVFPLDAREGACGLELGRLGAEFPTAWLWLV